MGTNTASRSLINQIGTVSSSQDLLAEARSKLVVSTVVSTLQELRPGCTQVDSSGGFASTVAERTPALYPR
jgi:hypothetical protein